MSFDINTIMSDNKKDKNYEEVVAMATPKKVTLKVAASPPIKQKLYYDVKVECMLPATLIYRVLAEDAEQAAELIKGMSPIGVKHRLIGKKDIKLTVYEAGSSMIKWVKNLLRT